MKKLAVIIAVLTAASAAVFAAEATPIKLSLIPSVSIPAAQTVNGLDLGILGTNVDEVQGIQLAWIYAGTKKKMVGLQLGFVDITTEATGVQYGFYNSTQNLTGIQLGFINVARQMKGLQIGLVNIIKKDGLLPFMVFVNGSF